MIIVLRRSNRSASAPATGPSSSAGSSVTRNTPPTAELAATPPRVRLGARAASARIDSQSPRLDRDSAIQRYRNGLIDSTDSPERLRLTRRVGGPSPRVALAGWGRKFTALRVPTGGLVPMRVLKRDLTFPLFRSSCVLLTPSSPGPSSTWPTWPSPWLSSLPS